MITPILLLMAEEGFLPETYDDASLDEAVEKFIDFCFEEDRLDLVEKINRYFGLDLKTISQNLSEECGPYCGVLRTNLEARCNLQTCPHWEKNFSFACSKHGKDLTFNPSEEDLKDALDLVAKFSVAKVFEAEFPKTFEIIEHPGCCICGAEEASPIYKGYHLCSNCQATVLGGRLRMILEIEFGRPILEILSFVTKKWHSPQEQAKSLGIKVSSLRELCASFSINPTKYRTKDEKRFTNPFANKRRGKDNSGAHLQRLWFRFVAYRRIHPVRPMAQHLANHLLSQANSFLGPRGLEEFTLIEI